MRSNQHILHVAFLVNALRHVESGHGAHLVEGGGGAAGGGVGTEVLLAAGILDTGRHVPAHVYYLFAGPEPRAIEDVFAHCSGLGSGSSRALVRLKLTVLLICCYQQYRTIQSYII